MEYLDWSDGEVVEVSAEDVCKMNVFISPLEALSEAKSLSLHEVHSFEVAGATLYRPGCNIKEYEKALSNEYKGRKVKLNKPFRTPKESKKFGVYVKNDKGNVVLVRFGDPNMEIKRDDKKRRDAFRSRHNCSNPGPRWKARYWSCKFWEKGKTVTDLT